MKKKEHEEALEAKSHQKISEHANAKSHQPIKKERKKKNVSKK